MEHLKIPSFSDFCEYVESIDFFKQCDEISILICDALKNGSTETQLFYFNVNNFDLSDIEQYFNDILKDRGWCVEIHQDDICFNYYVILRGLS